MHGTGSRNRAPALRRPPLAPRQLAGCCPAGTTRGQSPLAQRRGSQRQAEQRASTVSSMTVANKIEKRFLGESRQGVAPGCVFASHNLGCSRLPLARRLRSAPLPGASPGSPLALPACPHRGGKVH